MIRCYLVTRSAKPIGWLAGQGNGKHAGCVYLSNFWGGLTLEGSAAVADRQYFTNAWHLRQEERADISLNTCAYSPFCLHKWGASFPKNRGENLLKRTVLCTLGTRALLAVTSPKLTTLRSGATATKRLQSNTAGTNEKRYISCILRHTRI